MRIIRNIVVLLVAVGALRSFAATNDLIKFSGTVVDSVGNSVVGAAVECYNIPSSVPVGIPEQNRQHATTDATGSFAFSVPSGAVIVVVRKAGFATGWRTWQSVSVGVVDPLVLTKPSVLAGTVVDENDQPLAGVEVSVSSAVDRREGDWATKPNFLFGKAAADLFSARTSADGHFRIANFPIGAQANFIVKATGRVLQAAPAVRNGMQMQAQSGQEEIKLVAEPAASIEGRVVVRDTGTPLAGATVQLLPVNASGGLSISPQSDQSGAEGAFRIAEVPAGAYHVLAIFTNQPIPLWVTESVPVTVVAGGTARDVKIQAFKGGIVGISVIGKHDQKGVRDVNVSAYSDGYPATGTTGDDGGTWFRLPPGQFTIFATKQGLAQVQTQAMVIDGGTNRVMLELDLPPTIAGMIRDASGSPVPGTSVTVFPNFGGKDGGAQSGADGHYEVTWQKPPVQDRKLYVLARNASRHLAAVREMDESAASLDLELKPAISLSGRVQDAAGKAITNATGYVVLQMANMGSPISRQPIHADEMGLLRIEALPSGERYSINVSAKGYGSGQLNMVGAKFVADHYELPPVVLKLADRKLAGRVLGADGQPVAGVQVWMRGDGQPNGNAKTDADGRFAFESVCEGPVSLSASSKGQAGSFDGRGGDTNVTIRFGVNNRVNNPPGSLAISGTVFDPSGNPAPEARVDVTPSSGRDGSVLTDTNGEYSLHWQSRQGLTGVKYFVVARDIKRNLAGLEEIDEKKTNASVRMESGLSIAGTVKDADGKPLAGANVNLNIMTGNSGGLVVREPVRTDPDGAFTISALPKGQQYNVFISAADHGSVRRNITKAQSETNNIKLLPFELKAADRQLAGQVVAEDGKPLPGAQVYVYGDNQPNTSAQTDATGHFKFKVCEGLINVNAYVPQGGPRNNYANVQAIGGDLNVVVKMGTTPRRQQPRQRQPVVIRKIALKPQPWTLGALIDWSADHKVIGGVLLGAQAAALLGAAGAALWMAMKRKR